jgi:Fuc2NAc and GlcNAc transferase
MIELAATLAAAFVATLLLTAWTRRVGLRFGVLDLPNERSSHSRPTPRGGGLAVVISASTAIGVFALWRWVDHALAAALIGGGLFIAATGFLDDRRSLPAGIRILAHLAAASWAMYVIGGLPPIRIGAQAVSIGIWGDAAGIVAIVWVLNLFNFMDGIDGIAASEAVFVTGAGGALAIVFGRDIAVGYSAFAIAATALAFLCWNWPPAKIFMGDVGSGYLGYVIAVLALAAGRTSPVAVSAWLILGGVFFADATTTLFVRVVRGERIYLPHRDHAYQHLAVRWGGHRPVTLLVCAVNLFALLPLAVLAFDRRELAAALTAATIAGLSAVVLWIRTAKFPSR